MGGQEDAPEDEVTQLRQQVRELSVRVMYLEALAHEVHPDEVAAI